MDSRMSSGQMSVPSSFKPIPQKGEVPKPKPRYITYSHNVFVMIILIVQQICETIVRFVIEA